MKKQIFVTAIFSLLLFSCNQKSQQNGNEVNQEIAGTTANNDSNENQIPEEIREDVEKAIDKVRALPEVSAFLNENKETSIVEFDHQEGDTLVIHVYKVVLDEDGGAHTATLNWYQVNRKDGNITTVF